MPKIFGDKRTKQGREEAKLWAMGKFLFKVISWVFRIPFIIPYYTLKFIFNICKKIVTNFTAILKNSENFKTNKRNKKSKL